MMYFAPKNRRFPSHSSVFPPPRYETIIGSRTEFRTILSAIRFTWKGLAESRFSLWSAPTMILVDVVGGRNVVRGFLFRMPLVQVEAQPEVFNIPLNVIDVDIALPQWDLPSVEPAPCGPRHCRGFGVDLIYVPLKDVWISLDRVAILGCHRFIPPLVVLGLPL